VTAAGRGRHRRNAVAAARTAAPGFRDVFAVAEFRALWAAQLLSVAGDQLARVALTVLVYDRTRSALLAAVAYAGSIVPVFLGGILLSGAADRRPRRQVMIICDLARVPLAALMAFPGMPLTALIALLCAVTAIGAPFASARAAIYPEVLGEARYPLGTAVTMTGYQFAQVAGFAVGGTVVALAGSRIALLADAGTFLASAVLVRTRVRSRPAATAGSQPHPRRRGDLRAGMRLVLGNRSIRTPMLLGWISAFYNVPEGLAAPLARNYGGGPVAVGLILAAAALGSSAGGLALTRLVGPEARQHWTAPLAVGACAVLMTVALRPGLQVVLVILLISGLCDSFQVSANAAFVAAVPDQQRGQAFGLAVAGMNLGQGAAMILAGAVAQRLGPTAVIAAAGAAGAMAAALITLAGRRLDP
jgi:predicted MFS family arabinose efflux permease